MDVIYRDPSLPEPYLMTGDCVNSMESEQQHVHPNTKASKKNPVQPSSHFSPQFLYATCYLTDLILQSKGFNYGFIEYDDPGAAERAMQTLNGRRVHQQVSVTKYPCVEIPELILWCLGDSRKLGLSVKHLQQGGYIRPFSYFRR